MRRGLIAASLALLVSAVAVTAGVAKTAAPATAAQVAECTNVSLGSPVFPFKKSPIA